MEGRLQSQGRGGKETVLPEEWTIQMNHLNQTDPFDFCVYVFGKTEKLGGCGRADLGVYYLQNSCIGFQLPLQQFITNLVASNVSTVLA